ncbi:MAG: hypothetical protein WCX88_04455 [Patescibacteria group bacterium]
MLWIIVAGVVVLLLIVGILIRKYFSKKEYDPLVENPFGGLTKLPGVSCHSSEHAFEDSRREKAEEFIRQNVLVKDNDGVIRLKKRSDL